MFERRRARILLAALTLISLALITVDFRSGTGGPLEGLRTGVTAVFGPVQRGVSAVLRPVGDFFSGIGDLFTLRQENTRLRDRIADLELEHQSLADLDRENERLRDLLGMQRSMHADSPEFRFVAGTVIARGTGEFEYVITIDVGSDQGLREGMAVIDGDGLVGRVILVTGSYARVLLAIDPNFSAAAHTAQDGEQGFVKGRGPLLMTMTLLDPEAPVDEGDEVVTSSYENGTYPNGIPIGIIESVGEEDANQLTRAVTVRPFVDFSSLLHVAVIVGAPPPEPLPSPEPSISPSPTVTPTVSPT